VGFYYWNAYVQAMSESDDIESIRESKKERIRENSTVSQSNADSESTDGAGTERPSSPVHVESGKHLESVTSSHDVVLVDFYADWCGPCKMVEPVVEAIHEEGSAVVAKVDIDQHQQIAHRQNVRGVPTMVLYVDGDPADRVVGAKDKAGYEALIDQHT
jgi:thioredoxin 1